MPKSHPKHRQSAHQRTKAPQSIQQLRIIGGQWRGRKLSFPAVEGLRPTGDRVRETLFNWLQPIVPGAHCLDMYAGSGALGLEALSRGAKHVQFVELERRAAQQLESHLDLLQARPLANVYNGKSVEWLTQQQTPAVPFDLVFMDPPFQEDLWSSSIAALDAGYWLADGAFVYIETPVQHLLAVPPHWELHREKRSGNVRFALYVVRAASTNSDAGK